MGQYHIVANLTKKEFIHPHRLGCGLKMWEQIVCAPGTPSALFLLTCATKTPRGGGDLATDEDIIGRWAGDRIAVVGDYSEDEDMKRFPYFGCVYALCQSMDDLQDRIQSRLKDKSKRWQAEGRKLQKALDKYGLFMDISDAVAHALEGIFEGHYVGNGWRSFVSNEDYANPPTDTPEHLLREIKAHKALAEMRQQPV